MQDKKLRWGTILVLLLAFLLAACGADTDALSGVNPGAGDGQEPAEVSEVEPAAESSDGGVQILEPELGFAPGDPNLKASNPSNFVRAAGQPQLVELFAFW